MVLTTRQTDCTPKPETRSALSSGAALGLSRGGQIDHRHGFVLPLSLCAADADGCGAAQRALRAPAPEMLTRSRTKAARVEAAATTEPSLPDQPPEILNLIGEALAADEDVLQPRHLGALSRSCKVVKAAVKDSLAKVKVEHEAARALCNKCGDTVEQIVEARPTTLGWANKHLTAADMPALVSVLKSEALAQLEQLWLNFSNLGDEGAAAIAAAAAGGGLPRLKQLHLHDNQIGVAGVQALATAFAGGACRELEVLWLSRNAIGAAGLVALAAALERGALPRLQELYLGDNGIGADGVKALMAAAGGGRLAKLKRLDIWDNEFGEEGVEALANAMEASLPSLMMVAVGRQYIDHPRLKAAGELRAQHGLRGVLLTC